MAIDQQLSKDKLSTLHGAVTKKSAFQRQREEQEEKKRVRCPIYTVASIIYPIPYVDVCCK
jgi:hypothetical protein